MPRPPVRKSTPTRGPAKPSTGNPAADLPPWLRVHSDRVRLALRIQPRSSHDSVQGEWGGYLRIRLTAPPVDSRANEALIQFLARKLNCSRSQVLLLSGHTARLKLVEVQAIPAAEILNRLLPHPANRQP